MNATTVCPGCGATYAGAPPTCLICGRALSAATPPPPVPPVLEGRAPRGSRRSRVTRIVSIVSMVAGLASTGVGAVRALGSHASDTPRHAAAIAMAPSSPSPAASSPSPSPAASSSCSNDVFGYTLRYPSAWTTSSATPEQGCSYFDTAPVSRTELLQASRHGRLARTPIRIYPYGTSYGRAVIAIHNRSDLNADNTIDLGVGNTYGERILARVTTAAGNSTRVFLYLFSVRGKAFVADAYEPYSRDFGETMRVLDRMMRSLHVQ